MVRKNEGVTKPTELGRIGPTPLADNVFAYLRVSSHPFTAEKLYALENTTSFFAKFWVALRRAVTTGIPLPRDVVRYVSPQITRAQVVGLTTLGRSG